MLRLPCVRGNVDCAWKAGDSSARSTGCALTFFAGHETTRIFIILFFFFELFFVGFFCLAHSEEGLGGSFEEYVGRGWLRTTNAY